MRNFHALLRQIKINHNINILNGSWISDKPSCVPQAKESPVFYPKVLVSWDQRRELGQSVWSENQLEVPRPD